MKSHSVNGIEWFLDDEGLVEPLRAVVPTGGTSRGYFSFDHGGKHFFLKSFKEPGAAGFFRNKVLPRGAKEYRSAQRLLEMSILTPKPVGYGASDRESYIIQEWIRGDTFLNVFFVCGSRPELILKLADLLRTLKEHGVRHNDLHLNNVIVSDGDLYLIDLHKMAVRKRFGTKDEVSNLSHAIVMIYDGMTAKEKALFFGRYGAQDMKPVVEREMKRLQERWIRKKQERAFKNTSMLSVRADRVYMSGRETIADGQPVRLIKKDRKTTVEQHGDHVRKTYRDGRRLRRAWKNHVTLKYLDLAVTPEPYYVKVPSLFSKGYVAMEDLTGSGEELDRYLDRNYDRMTGRERKAFIENLALFFGRLFKKRTLHKDLKGCNIFVLNRGGFLLLDVEDFQFAAVNGESLKRMLVQLNTTIPARVSVKDRMRFYLCLVKGLQVDKKAVFQEAREESLKNEIVYESLGGLKREAWSSPEA